MAAAARAAGRSAMKGVSGMRRQRGSNGALLLVLATVGLSWLLCGGHIQCMGVGLFMGLLMAGLLLTTRNRQVHIHLHRPPVQQMSRPPHAPGVKQASGGLGVNSAPTGDARGEPVYWGKQRIGFLDSQGVFHHER